MLKELLVAMLLGWALFLSMGIAALSFPLVEWTAYTLGQEGFTRPKLYTLPGMVCASVVIAACLYHAVAVIRTVVLNWKE